MELLAQPGTHIGRTGRTRSFPDVPKCDTTLRQIPKNAGFWQHKNGVRPGPDCRRDHNGFNNSRGWAGKDPRRIELPFWHIPVIPRFFCLPKVFDEF
jgi:hypothetical protein